MSDPTLPQDIAQKIEKFVAQKDAIQLGLPSNLSSLHRRLVHEKAELLGLEHISVGAGNERHIVLKKKPTPLPAQPSPTLTPTVSSAHAAPPISSDCSSTES